MSDSAPTVRNKLLADLPEGCLDILRPFLEPVLLEVGDVIEKPNVPISHVIFPESGLVSIIAGVAEYRVEVGLIGRDGMTGTSIVLGADSSPHECLVQIAGEALRIPAGELKSALQAQVAMRAWLLLYVRALLVQTAQTAVAHGRCSIVERLARWILMADDRLDGRDVPLTHGFLSLMLGVTRPGVTIALNTLERDKVISTARGRITVLDRDGLERIASAAYTPSPLLY